MGDFIREHKIISFSVAVMAFLLFSAMAFVIFGNKSNNPPSQTNLAQTSTNQITANGSYASSVGYSTGQSSSGNMIHSYITKPAADAYFQEQENSNSNSNDNESVGGEEVFSFEETPAITVFKEYFGDDVFNPEVNEGAVNVAKELVSSGMSKVSATDMKTTLDTMVKEKTTNYTPWSISKKYHEIKKEPIYEKVEEKTGEVYHVYDVVDKQVKILETPAMQAWSDATGKNIFDPANTPNAFDVAKIMTDETVSKLTYGEVFDLLSTAKKEVAELDLATLAGQVNEAFGNQEDLPENLKLALHVLTKISDIVQNGNVNSYTVSDLFNLLKKTAYQQNINTNIDLTNLPDNPLQNTNLNQTIPANPLGTTENQNQNSTLPINPWGSNTNTNGQVEGSNQNGFFSDPNPAGTVVSSSGGDEGGGGGEGGQDPMQMIQQIMGILGMLKMLPEKLAGLLGGGEQETGKGKQGGDEAKGP